MGYIAYSLSNKQSQGRWEEGEDSLARGTLRKATAGQNLQQLDEVPRSLGGRSRKAKKVAKSRKLQQVGITELGGIGLETRALEVLKPKLLLRAISIKNFLGV